MPEKKVYDKLAHSFEFWNKVGIIDLLNLFVKKGIFICKL